MKKTCLHSKHIEAGAMMAPFAGFDMPISYEGIEAEHQAVRANVGVFDVSHMGEVVVSGSQAEAFVNYIFSGDVSVIENGKIVYGMMLNDCGGVVDDLLVYKRDVNEYFLVINASNIDKDVEWLMSHASNYDVTIDNQSDHWAELAIQGPNAETTIERILGVDCSDLSFYTFKDVDIDGLRAIISRTGYTGEDGFELYAPAQIIEKAWGALISGSVIPCGLGCRDTLRFEAGLPLYGDELSDSITPFEAGLGAFVKLDKDDFIGKEALMAQKQCGVKRKLVGLEVEGRAIARHGYEVVNEQGETVGHVTTGYHSISLDRNLAMALVDSRYAEQGTLLRVQVRKKLFPARVVNKRFYKPNYKRQ